MTNDQPVFRTKTGYCHVLPDRIVLTDDGIVENAVSKNPKKGLYTSIAIYACLVALCAWELSSSWQKKKVFDSFLFGFLVLYPIYPFLASLYFATDRIVERSAVRSVVFKKAVPYVSRSRFIVYFSDAKGRIRKRLILLPGYLNEGDRHTAEAVAVMEHEGLIPQQEKA